MTVFARCDTAGSLGTCPPQYLSILCPKCRVNPTLLACAQTRSLRRPRRSIRCVGVGPTDAGLARPGLALVLQDQAGMRIWRLRASRLLVTFDGLRRFVRCDCSRGRASDSLRHCLASVAFRIGTSHVPIRMQRINGTAEQAPSGTAASLANGYWK